MKLKDVSPKEFSCQAGGCPAVYKTDRGTYLIIGTEIDSPDNLLPGRIGPNETAIEVSVGLIQGITTK